MCLILFQIFTNSIEYQWPWVIYSEYIFAWWDIIMIHTCCMVYCIDYRYLVWNLIRWCFFYMVQYIFYLCDILLSKLAQYAHHWSIAIFDYHIGLRKSKFVMYIFIILNNQPYRNSHAILTQMLSTNFDTAVLCIVLYMSNAWIHSTQ